MTVTRYLATEATAGRQIYTSYSRRPQPFATRQTAICDTPWCISVAAGGDLDRIASIMSRAFGLSVRLIEAGPIEVIPV